MSVPRDRSARTKPIVVTIAGALILLAAVAALMGWLPLKPKNDLLRSLQRLGSLSFSYAAIRRDWQAVVALQKATERSPIGASREALQLDGASWVHSGWVIAEYAGTCLEISRPRVRQC